MNVGGILHDVATLRIADPHRKGQAIHQSPQPRLAFSQGGCALIDAVFELLVQALEGQLSLLEPGNVRHQAVPQHRAIGLLLGSRCPLNPLQVAGGKGDASFPVQRL